jgi:hypothetical protein
MRFSPGGQSSGFRWICLSEGLRCIRCLRFLQGSFGGPKDRLDKLVGIIRIDKALGDKHI